MLHGLHARLPYTFLPVSAFKIEFSSRNKPRCQTNQSHCFLLKASAVSLQLHQWQQLPSCSTKSTTSIPSLKVKIQLFFGLSNATGCYVQLTLNGTLKARLVLAMTWKISFDYCCLTFVDCHSQEQRWDKAITKSQLMIINVVTQSSSNRRQRFPTFTFNSPLTFFISRAITRAPSLNHHCSLKLHLT